MNEFHADSLHTNEINDSNQIDSIDPLRKVAYHQQYQQYQQYQNYQQGGAEDEDIESEFEVEEIEGSDIDSEEIEIKDETTEKMKKKRQRGMASLCKPTQHSPAFFLLFRLIEDQKHQSNSTVQI